MTRAVLAGMLLAMVALAGCNRSPNVLVGYERSTGGVATNLQIANPRLQKRIALIGADARRANDVLQVKVHLESRARKTLQFEYMFQWLDADDFEISDVKSHWTPTMIHGRQTMLIQGIAPDAQAVTFKLLVRSPAPVKR